MQGLRHASRPSRPIVTILSRPSLTRLTPLDLRFLSTETRAAIDQAVASRPVVLFMKGTPETPQCGFSKACIQILGLQGVDPNKFSAFNVLEDEELRQGTIPFDLPSMCSHSRPRIERIFGLAYNSTALHRQGIRWGMRHINVNASERGAFEDTGGEGSPYPCRIIFRRTCAIVSC